MLLNFTLEEDKKAKNGDAVFFKLNKSTKDAFVFFSVLDRCHVPTYVAV